MAGFSFETRREGAVAVVRLRGEARLELVEPFRAEAKSLLAGGVKHLLLDAAGLQFVDSASFGVVLELVRDAERAGGSVAVFGASARVRRTVDAMGVGERLRLAPDEATARKALGL